VNNPNQSNEVLTERMDEHQRRLGGHDALFEAISRKMDVTNRILYVGMGIFITVNAILGWLAALHR
jgi:hypothetical protein